MTPQALTLAQNRLEVSWSDGSVVSLTAAALRRSCRCGDCRALAARREPVQVAPALAVLDARPVGAYGVQLEFSDGHDRGIYPWPYLRELGRAAAAEDYQPAGSVCTRCSASSSSMAA
ncbi:DUF971 domain-containing protein [Eleftheria terrae]|uniref:DUF971 domain-containing protein n=1 Tax=Eleftheria terrae TaxID=1597781 RepID=UPI00263B460D|nr:DUF971 domain-containing protein [Eleftheria terrae]WKB54682.1 DUF971 domain-containing protein [Eleftheria terrae]